MRAIAAGGVRARLWLALRSEISTLSMSGSNVLVAVNALLLKRLRLPKTQEACS
jgi:P-type Cu2+ transporter